MATPFGPRPGKPPPSYNPNSLANNMQNFHINQPNQPPSSNPAGSPSRPSNTAPFGQQPPPFAGTQPRPPPPNAFVRGPVPRSPSTPPQTTLSPNVASGRPTGPPPGVQPHPPFASRPLPPGSLPALTGVATVSVASGSLQQFGPGPRPGPFISSPPTRSPPIQPPSSTSSPRFPVMGSRLPPPIATSQPATMLSSRSPSAPSQHMTPSAAPFSSPIQSVPPSGSPVQAWTSQQQQVAGPPPFPGLQRPRMFGMPAPPPNQSMAPTSPDFGHTGAAMTAGSMVDHNHIPRPISSSVVILHDTRQGNQANPPPPATSDYIVKDTGNCSPRFMRCTVNQIPCTVDLLSTSAMQLALLVQPFALPHPSEEPIQVVDFGESGPVRCSRCKAYINPFMKFIDQGRRFICNFCGFTDETPRDYHCNLGPDGRRRDADERPELCRGTVEFVASKEYMVRDPMPAVYFFLIDVSMNAIQTGATAAACSAINQVIADLPEGPRTAVGIATFDSSIHFYNLKRALQQPLMLIVPDIQDVYTPLESDVIVQLSECRQHLEILLESIPVMFQNNKICDSAFGAAIKAAFLAMKCTGGKLLVFQSVLPSIGTGSLSAREAEGQNNISRGEKEANKLLQPADKTLTTMAMEFAEYQVCVDLFITTQAYTDIASISVIPRTTGGQVYCYYPFTALSDPAKLYNDLRWNVTRPQGFEAVMRVRCSSGIQVQDYSGNFCRRIPTDVDLPAIDCDKTIMVTLKHDDRLQEGSECAFQCALLYTTVYGQRRIRVSTLSLPCSATLSNLFQFADLETQLVCMLKQVTSEVPSTALQQVAEHAKNLCINILHSYRKFCTSASASGQLILPEALKLLPLYMLALLKGRGLQGDGRIDDRSFWINSVSHLSAPSAIAFVYPRMIAIHNLDEKELAHSFINETLPLSSEHISNEGIYLLENGEDCLIYVGDSVNPDILRQLLGISSVEEVSNQLEIVQKRGPIRGNLFLLHGRGQISKRPFICRVSNAHTSTDSKKDGLKDLYTLTNLFTVLITLEDE